MIIKVFTEDQGTHEIHLELTPPRNYFDKDREWSIVCDGQVIGDVRKRKYISGAGRLRGDRDTVKYSLQFQIGKEEMNSVFGVSGNIRTYSDSANWGTGDVPSSPMKLLKKFVELVQERNPGLTIKIGKTQGVENA